MLVQELVHFVTIVQSLLWMQSLKLGIPYFFDQTPRLLVARFVRLLFERGVYFRPWLLPPDNRWRLPPLNGYCHWIGGNKATNRLLPLVSGTISHELTIDTEHRG